MRLTFLGPIGRHADFSFAAAPAALSPPLFLMPPFVIQSDTTAEHFSRQNRQGMTIYFLRLRLQATQIVVLFSFSLLFDAAPTCAIFSQLSPTDGIFSHRASFTPQ